mmetsp:Transcript_5809/g.9652  ORF Transcript_5809/g.9652 Transcript_5809/m.9652 type:complete len:116 (-) Transcript_5809:56-403(-)
MSKRIRSPGEEADGAATGPPDKRTAWIQEKKFVFSSYQDWQSALSEIGPLLAPAVSVKINASPRWIIIDWSTYDDFQLDNGNDKQCILHFHPSAQKSSKLLLGLYVLAQLELPWY